jgi:hypothetical protein
VGWGSEERKMEAEVRRKMGTWGSADWREVSRGKNKNKKEK